MQARAEKSRNLTLSPRLLKKYLIFLERGGGERVLTAESVGIEFDEKSDDA